MDRQTAKPGIAEADTVCALPRIIWTLWLQGPDRAPPLVRACLDSWRQRNPAWQVQVLDSRRLAEMFGGWWNELAARVDLDPSALADRVRLELLARHGGVWVDATCFCVRPLDDWLPHSLGSGFFAFRRPGPDRLLSSWFLAARAQHSVILGWRRLTIWYLEQHRFDPRPAPRLKHALERWLSRDDRRSRLWFSYPVRRMLKVRPYFWLHYLFAELIRSDSQAASCWQATPVYSADGPHALQVHGLLAPSDARVEALIAEARIPVFKLSWKLPVATIPPDTVLAALLRSLPGTPPPAGADGRVTGDTLADKATDQGEINCADAKPASRA